MRKPWVVLVALAAISAIGAASFYFLQLLEIVINSSITEPFTQNISGVTKSTACKYINL
jgi:hypothetical protein